MKGKLLQKNQLKSGKVYYNMERNKNTGKVRYVKCSTQEITFLNGKKKMYIYGIWESPSSYESLGYIQPIKTRRK